MTVSLEAPSVVVPAQLDVNDDVHRRSDWMFLLGAMAVGTFLLGPVGLVPLLLGFRHLRRAQRAGRPVRSWSITLIGVFCLADAAQNFVGWGFDTFAHDTLLSQTLWVHGYGRWADAAYYLGYNSRSFGGVPLSGEKALEASAVLFLFPIRIATAWAFLRMKRWGLQGMIVTSWMYAYMWVAYLICLTLDFDPRLTHNLYGMIGWWSINFWFITPFLMLPFLYTVDKEAFSN